jgi:hypothetical protein
LPELSTRPDFAQLCDIPVLDANAVGRFREGGGIVRYGASVEAAEHAAGNSPIFLGFLFVFP